MLDALDRKLQEKAALYISENPKWDVYNLASHLDVKASDIYLKLDQKTRLMLVWERRLLSCHVTAGLYPELEDND